MAWPAAGWSLLLAVISSLIYISVLNIKSYHYRDSAVLVHLWLDISGGLYAQKEVQLRVMRRNWL